MINDEYKKLEWGGSGMVRECFDWIRENIKDGSTIVEFGAGAISTPRLAPFYDIISFESSETWVEKVNTMIGRDVAIHAPFDGNKFYDADIVKEKCPSAIDLIILDGPPYTAASSREGFLDLYARGFMDSSATILVDDLHRQKDMEIAVELSLMIGKTLDVHNVPGHAFGIIQ